MTGRPLAQLLRDVPGVIAIVGEPSCAISGIVSDSRQASPGALFVAYRGVDADGHRFIADALAHGAAAIVGEEPAPSALAAPYVQVADARCALAWLSAAWYGHPSRSMGLVGITGTDGKTTTANILYSILRAARLPAGIVSTVNAVIGPDEYETGLHTTTPDAPDVQRYLAQMRDGGARVAVLEVTSHGLAQHRVAGCAFDVAVVTNITHEHLDFHGTPQAYREAKALLFRSLTKGPQQATHDVKSGLPGLRKTAVLNRDDGSFEHLAQIPAERAIYYGIRGVSPEHRGMAAGVTALMAADIRDTPAGAAFRLSAVGEAALRAGEGGPIDLITPLVGRFNIYNIMAAVGAAIALGVGPEALQEGVRTMAAIPGRMERIDRGQTFTAIVDFAHTPNALASALAMARSLAAAHGRVIVVVGSAGLRDREKRRLMGGIAAAAADLTVITAEDPRTEDLASIMSEMAGALVDAGQAEGVGFVRIADRQRAILHAVASAGPGDVLIICGKGHEQSMCFGTTEHPWRDQDALRWALDRLQGKASQDPPYLLPTW